MTQRQAFTTSNLKNIARPSESIPPAFHNVCAYLANHSGRRLTGSVATSPFHVPRRECGDRLGTFRPNGERVSLVRLVGVVMVISFHLGTLSAATKTETATHLVKGPNSRPSVIGTGVSAPPRQLEVRRGEAPPSVTAVQRYINPTYMTVHTSTPFNSSDGDLIVICASSHEGVTFTPSDNFGNQWVTLAGPTDTVRGFNLRTQIWYAPNPKVGTSHRVTMTLSAPQPLVISMFVVRNSDRFSPIDVVSLIGSDRGKRKVEVASPAVVTARPHELIIGFDKVSAGATFQSGSAFIPEPGASSNFLDAEIGTTNDPGLYNVTFRLNKSQTWQAAAVAVANNPNQVAVTWAPPADAGSVAEYLVERCIGDNCDDFVEIGTATTAGFDDISLQPSTTYSYRVRSRNIDGSLSSYSSIASLKTPAATPSLPMNLAATTVSPEEIVLSWTAVGEASSSTSQYLVERCEGVECTNFAPIGTATSSEYRDRRVAAGSKYSYRVRVRDASGSVGPFSYAFAETKMSLAKIGSVGLVLLLLAAPWYRRLRGVPSGYQKIDVVDA